MAEGSNKGGGLPPGTILFLLAFLGVSAPLMLSTTHQTPSPMMANEKNANEISDKNSAEGLLEEFFNANQVIDAGQPWQEKAPNYPGPKSVWNPNDPRYFDQISFIIATLPNPDNPSLRYEFDRNSDTIQLALSHENYFLAKSYLPWAERPGLPATKDNPTDDSNGSAPAHSGRPGVMLFRRAEDANRSDDPTRPDNPNDDIPARDSLMVVFVVGETPTTGVDGSALRNALNQIAWLRGWTDGDTPAPPHLVQLTRDNPDEIHIIGPSYSGSAASMQQVLRSWLYFDGLVQPPPHISILSGSANAIVTWPVELGDFHSTQLPESQIFAGISTFFRENLGDPPLAILTDDTDYGNAIAKARQHPGDKPDGPDGFDKVTLLPYPIHISNLRTNVSSMQQTAPATTPLGMTHRDPPVSDEDIGQDSYLVPSFSRATAADDEVVLANLLATIHRENYHYVGIVATNIRDAIFLIREIRDNCPNTIPFLTSSDLLYLHSDYSRDLAGTLIFSTYPLFASNQLWTWPSNSDYRRLQFSSGESAGVYNAVLATLNDAPNMVEYTLPFSSASEVPPLWVSVVGNDALWPIGIYLGRTEAPSLTATLIGNSVIFVGEPVSVGGDSVGAFGKDELWPVRIYPSSVLFPRVSQPGSAESLPRNFGMSLYPHPFEKMFALVILLCTIPHLYMIKWRTMTGARVSLPYRLLGGIIPRPPSWLARLIDDFATVNRTNRRLTLLSFVLVLLTFFVVASAVWLLPLRAMSLWTQSSPLSCWRPPRFMNLRLFFWTIVPTLIAGLIIILSLVGFTGDQYRQARRIPNQSLWKTAWGFFHREASWTATYRFIASVIGLSLAVCFAISIWREDPLHALLYFVRAANLGNGVSPLVPMLYIGFAALCLSVGELWRLSLSEEYVVNENFLGFGDDGSFTGIGVHEQATVHLLKCPADEIPLWWLWITLPWVIYLLLDLPGIYWVALDGHIFTWFFIAIVTFFFTALLLLFGRFIAVWFQLSSLLRRLYMHPTRRAYEELRVGSVAPSMADRQRIWLVEPSDSVASVEFCLVRVREMLRQVEPSASFAPGSIADRVSMARDALSALVVNTQTYLNAVSRYEAIGSWRAAIKAKCRLQIAMSDLSRRVIEIFEPWWRLEITSGLTPKPLSNQPAGLTPKPLSNQPAPDETLIKQAELFVAGRVLDFLRQVYPQMTHLVVFVTIGLLGLILAISSYPFPHRDTFVWLSWVILLSVIGVTFVIFVQINRDRVMSMLSGTTPGQLNWNGNFVWRVVIFAVIPVLILLGAQFPHALQGFFSSFGGALGGAH